MHYSFIELMSNLQCIKYTYGLCSHTNNSKEFRGSKNILHKFMHGANYRSDLFCLDFFWINTKKSWHISNKKNLNLVRALNEFTPTPYGARHILVRIPVANEWLCIGMNSFQAVFSYFSQKMKKMSYNIGNRWFLERTINAFNEIL